MKREIKIQVRTVLWTVDIVPDRSMLSMSGVFLVSTNGAPPSWSNHFCSTDIASSVISYKHKFTYILWFLTHYRIQASTSCEMDLDRMWWMLLGREGIVEAYTTCYTWSVNGLCGLLEASEPGLRGSEPVAELDSESVGVFTKLPFPWKLYHTNVFMQVRHPCF